MASQNADMLYFVQQMIVLRKRHPSIMRRRFLTGKTIDGKNMTDIAWHGAQLDCPQWLDSETRILAFTLAGSDDNEADVHIVMNMSDDNVTADLPVINGKEWCLAVDTSLPSYQDIVVLQNQKPLSHHSYLVSSKSVVAFENTK